MSESPPRRARSEIVAGSFPALVAVAGAVQAWTDVAYPDVTNTRRSYIDFNIEVVRGFVFRISPSFECFSVNAYESTIVRHASLSGAPSAAGPRGRTRRRSRSTARTCPSSGKGTTRWLGTTARPVS